MNRASYIYPMLKTVSILYIVDASVLLQTWPCLSHRKPVVYWYLYADNIILV